MFGRGRSHFRCGPPHRAMEIHMAGMLSSRPAARGSLELARGSSEAPLYPSSTPLSNLPRKGAPG